MAESTFISNFIVLPSEPFRKDAAANSDGGSITVCTRLIGGARMVNRNRSVTSTRHQAGITRLRAIEFPMGVFTSFATRQQMETRTFDEPTGAQRTETDDSAGNRPQGAAPPHQTGNWLSDTTASPALSQTRTHDKANQITDLTGPSGVIDPVYDP